MHSCSFGSLLKTEDKNNFTNNATFRVGKNVFFSSKIWKMKIIF